MYVYIYHTHTHIHIYTHTHIYNGILAIKRNKIMPLAATWMDLEIIILNEVSQTKTNTICYHSYVGTKIRHK